MNLNKLRPRVTRSVSDRTPAPDLTPVLNTHMRQPAVDCAKMPAWRKGPSSTNIKGPRTAPPKRYQASWMPYRPEDGNPED